jgi:hypothetical protein
VGQRSQKGGSKILGAHTRVYSDHSIVALAGWNNNRNCAGVGYFCRTDRQEVIDWILDTGPESEASAFNIVEL